MPVDPEIMQLVHEVSIKLPTDQNRPYQIRRRKKATQKDSRGSNVDQTPEFELRTIENIRTQPLAENAFNRLPEGLRKDSWRFVMVVPAKIGELPSTRDEMLDFGDQIEYKGHWYEVKFLNDWDLIQHAKAVFVE
jgi:hypothetical protein